MQPMYTLPEAAEHLRIAERTLRRYVATRRIRHCRIGEKILFQQAWLEEFILARTEPVAGGAR